MKALSYLNKYFIKYKWHLLLGVLFIIVTNIFKAYMPAYFGESIDELKEWNHLGLGRNIILEAGECLRNTGGNFIDIDKLVSPLPEQNVIITALRVGGIYMLMALASGFFLFLTRQSIIIMSRHIEYDMKNEIYQQYQRLSYSFYRKNNTGDLLNRISEDVSKVRMYIGPGIMYTINLVILFILVVVNMIQINGYLTIVVLIPLPLMSFIIYFVASRINKTSAIVQKEQSVMSTLVQEAFSGIRVVKAYDRQDEIVDKFNQSADAYKRKNMRLVLINALFMPTIFILVGVSTILCIYLGGIFHIADPESLTIGDIAKFIFYVNLLTWPFASVGWVVSLVQRASASQERINEFLKEKPEIINTTDAPIKFEKTIEFRNVSYQYPNSGIEAIKDVSFTLNKGETLGIIGRTGSGKTTIIQLITRQLEPSSGEILIDGVPLKEINLHGLLDLTAVVPQDVFLFSDTIRNNIAFGSRTKTITEEDLIRVTKTAYVHHNIVEFNDGFDTLLGERGVNLSGGQKQRVSIARALIREPELLLLDDCLSAVDTETEEAILNNFNKLESVTSIIVSHRVSSIRHAHRIINIQEGSIVEEGTHEELLSLNGLYKELYEKQLAEEES